MNLPIFNKKGRTHLLRIIFISGLMLFVLTCATLFVFYLTERNNTRITRQQDNFAQALRQYDIQIQGALTERDYERLNRELDRLERMTIGVESWLSVLKRRRALTHLHPPSMENYRRSVNNAIEAYPFSQPIAAIAAEALIKNAAIDREREETLRQWLTLLTDPSFNSLSLSLHVLLGDFRSPQRAANISSNISSGGIEEIMINLTILKILRGDYRGAAADIQTILFSHSPSDASLRLAAEFHYDYGDLRRSAEIFSFIDDDNARIRQADALYLAGYKDSAKSIWSILAFPSEESDQSFMERSLYNLGVTAESHIEAAAFFQRLHNIDNTHNKTASNVRQFGLIRYSRLLDFPRAIEVLENTESLAPSSHPFIDLELCKRRSQYWELGRQLAETWFLLDRHDENEDMYRWAAWFFLFQRNYSEIRILLDRIENLRFREQWSTEPWPEVYRAIQLMFEGNLETAEDILRSIPAEYAEWAVHANLGRIMEAYASPSRALEQYELAAMKMLSTGNQNPQKAAAVQIRIARCFSILNRPNDALRALLYAIEFDPDNLIARLELDRLLY
jgi:tetratricopeptide (TPR) repeat protein